MNRNRCLAVMASAVAVLLAPVRTPAASAYGQLQELCRETGGNCKPNVPTPSPPSPAGNAAGVQQGEAVQSARPSTITNHHNVRPPPPPVQRAPPKKTPEQKLREEVRLQLAQGLVQGFLNALLAPAAAPSGPSPEQLAEQERQRAEEERQRIAEFQARAALVSEQRAARNTQQASNMETMAASMSAGWDGAASSAGGSGPVQLEGTTPALFAPPVYRPRPPANPAAQRLATLAAENEDVAVLNTRFAELSSKLDAAKKEADAIGRMSRNRVEEYEQMERTVAQGVADAWDRGMSLAMDGLLLGHAKAIDRVGEVQSNARAWNEMKSMLRDTQRAADFLEDANDKVDKLLQLKDDIAFLRRQREFKEDLAYLGERFGGAYYKQGTSILASARTVRDELQVLHRQGELQGFEGRYREQQKKVRTNMDQLLADVKRARREISLRTGIAEKDLPLPEVPLPRGSFGTKPPPVPVE